MVMQDDQPRRKPVVYGKAKRSAPAYNMFDLDNADGRVQTCSSSGQGEIQLEPQQIHSRGFRSAARSSMGKASKFHQRLRSKERPLSPGLSAQKERDGEQSPSVFNFPPSDDESSTILFEKSIQKRRRLTPVRNDNNVFRTQEREPSSPNMNGDRQPLPRATQRSAPRTRTSTPEEDNFNVKKPPYNTPKQTKLLSNILDAAGPVGSPSKLPFLSLSLRNDGDTPSESTESRSKPHKQTKQGQEYLLKPKSRLIDAMASPRKHSSFSPSPGSASEGLALDATESSPPTDGTENDSQSGLGASANEINDAINVSKISSTSLNAGSRPRITYSRERSHLADLPMEGFLDPSSQSARQEDSPPTSQDGTILSSFESVISHETPEEDLEQDVAGIRSIHELRYSGGKARSQVDLESVLEDIEATDPSARARRLIGLTQLTGKLADPEVGRHILEHSLDQRLSRCPALHGDVLEQTLLTMAMCRLVSSVQLAASSLEGVLGSLVSSGTTLLQETRELTSIVRDRKQNLSKATCKDITALVEAFCSSAVWPDRRPTKLSPRLVSIRCLDTVLRQLRQLGNFGMVLPASIFSELVRLLLRIDPTEIIEANDQDAILIMEVIISLIESLTISRNWAEDGCLEIAKRLSGLGPMLARLALSSAESSGRTHHLILRLILNITNNDSDLCNAFAEPALLSSIFDIVKRDFLQTPMVGDAVLREAEMEGVILALGALSNLAEHSRLFRQAMLETLLDGRSMVEWMALAFRDQVEVASEVRCLANRSFFANY
jgi:Wings apart-like protein regulation of heterochromatin